MGKLVMQYLYDAGAYARCKVWNLVLFHNWLRFLGIGTMMTKPNHIGSDMLGIMNV